MILRRTSRTEVREAQDPVNKAVSRQSGNSANQDLASSSNKKIARSSVKTQTLRDSRGCIISKYQRSKNTRQTRRTNTNGRSTTKNQSGRYNVGTNKNLEIIVLDLMINQRFLPILKMIACLIILLKLKLNQALRIFHCFFRIITPSKLVIIFIF